MSTALYRRYRPETFADVIGQEHVTAPLMAALANDRITHAYLFSGPRGCGKTTSARILARCLNCAMGPTATPCGTCDSCVGLARGGPGSLDVVEMDAASHGGVDDARDLRERAAFAPVRDRYKVFIIDEAHMVTPQGFNALLKLVEEPPPHVKFVFATTEPEKVIGTIRSRTHHYPFRLVPPDLLTQYLESLASAEQANVDSGVLALVVRAGGGSVRDSLSVLDQLIAGAVDGAVGYERAVALLGFTHATLLDDTVDALAARDGGSLFRVVDNVIGSGHAPRRFVEDLLERLRDLIVVRAAGAHAETVVRGLPADQLERMRTQASHLGPHVLSRSADLVNEALTEMSGATSPRLQLELLCARLLLPAADDGAQGFGARLDALESSRPWPSSLTDTPTQQPPTPGARAPVSPIESPGAGDQSPASAASPESSSAADRAHPAAPSVAAPEPEVTPVAQESPAASQQPEPPAQAPPAAAAQPTPPQAPQSGALTADQVRRRWPEVLETLAQMKRITWTLVSQDAQVVDVNESYLSLGFSTSGLASTFRHGPHADFLSKALQETLGLTVRINPVIAADVPPPSSDWNSAPASRPPSSSASDSAVAPSGSPGRASTPPPWDVPGSEESGDSTDAEDDPAQTTPAASTPVPTDSSTYTDPESEQSEQSDPVQGDHGWPELPPTELPDDRYASRSAGPASPVVPMQAQDGAPPAEPEGPPSISARDRAFQAARQVTAPMAEPVQVGEPTQGEGSPSLEDDTPDPNDPDIESTGLVGAPLVARLLGGTVIDEIVEHPDGSEQ